jgi:Zn-dependent metalloprotease/Tol biopolymer transport system component
MVGAIVLAASAVMSGAPAASATGGTRPVPKAAVATVGGLTSREMIEFKAFGTGNPGRWQYIANPGTGRVQDVFGAATAGFAGSPQAAASHFLAGNEALVNARSSDLRQAGFTAGKAAYHVVYRQYYKGVPVEGAVVQVHVDGKGRVFWVETLADPDVSLATTRARFTAADAERLAALDAGLTRIPAAHPATLLVVLPGEAGDRLTFKVRFHTDSPLGDWVYFVDALDGRIVAIRDELTDAAGTVTAKVYDRDPVATPVLAQHPVANEYVTVGGLRTTTAANGAYTSSRTGTVAATLTGPYARVVNNGHAAASRSGSTTSWTWNFATTDTHFDELNVFFHMNVIHDYFKQHFGIDQMDYAMTATVHYGDHYPNAFYSPQEQSLSFGDGDNVSARDSAKAAEVIYHEYGHATHDHVYAPLLQAGIYTVESRAMGEAWADYFSQVLTGGDLFGEWWVVNEAQRRSLVNTKRYPTDVQGEEHADGPILAGALWDYRMRAGGTDADKANADATVADSWTYRPTDFRSTLVAMLEADDELFGDMDLSNGTPHEAQIRAAFSAHGITTAYDDAVGPLVFARNFAGTAIPALYLAAADGTGAHMIPTTASWDWPDWNEEQRLIAASGSDALGNKVIYVIDPLTGVRAQLTGNFGPGAQVLAQHPSLSPAGDKVCFSWALGSGFMNLATADVTATMDPLKPVGTPVPGVHTMDYGANEWYPDWSKANGRIVFAELGGALLDKTKAGIWAVDPSGTPLTQLTHPVYYWWAGGNTYGQTDAYPKWSHAGDKIAYVRITTTLPTFGNATYDYDIYVMRADGADQPGTRVLQGRSRFPATLGVTPTYGLGALTWSPAGDALVFGVAGGADYLGFPTSYDLYRVGIDGGAPTRVTTDGGTATSSWGAIDTTPPVVTGVRIQAPIDRRDRLTFTVDAADPESGIYNFQYAIGTSPGGTEIRLWTTASGALNQFAATHLALPVGATCYVTVKARNGYGYVSAPVSSAGIGPPPDTRSDASAYYASTATITLTLAGGGGPGPVHTYYTLNGAAQVESSTVPVGSAGTYTLRFWSEGSGGNVEVPHTVVFTVVTPPSAGGTPSTPSTPASVRHGASFTTFGYVVRHTSGTSPVTLQFYRYQSGHWVLRKSATAKVSTVLAFSKYAASTSVPYSGRWRVRASHKVGSRTLYSGYWSFTAS